jgi:signal transduction histidine kinase
VRRLDRRHTRSHGLERERDLDSAGSRRKDEFLAVLAHELRNPLAPVRNAVELMKLDGSLSGRLVRARDVIERQVLHMARLLDDLLDAGRIARDKIELRKQPVELSALLREAIETSGPAIEAAKHELSLSLPASSLYVDADPVRLAQVFGNLLNNAVKYTKPHGCIRVTAARNGSEALVTVRDSGIGIRAGDLSSIFSWKRSSRG